MCPSRQPHEHMCSCEGSLWHNAAPGKSRACSSLFLRLPLFSTAPPSRPSTPPLIFKSTGAMLHGKGGATVPFLGQIRSAIQRQAQPRHSEPAGRRPPWRLKGALDELGFSALGHGMGVCVCHCAWQAVATEVGWQQKAHMRGEEGSKTQPRGA
jgi:hypothetical protein